MRMRGERPEEASGRRERKKRKTREALEKAALKLFREKGYDQTTIREITEEVDVSPRTFFRYFPTKEAVLFGDWAEGLDLIRDLILSRPPGEPPLATLYRAALELADMDRKNEPRLMLVRRLAERSRRIGDFERNVVYPGFEKAVAEALAERMGVCADTDPRPRMLAAVAVAAWTTARRMWMESGGKRSMSELLRQTFGFLVENREAGRARSVSGRGSSGRSGS